MMELILKKLIKKDKK